jgi:2-oxoisovalerate dehydrogenase E1 component
MLVLQNLPRRFGHAATDRQFAYMNQEEINGEIGRNPLAGLCAEAIAAGIMSESEIEDRYNSIQDSVETAFTIAINEPKIDSRDALVASNSRPLQPRESKDGSDSPNIAGTLYASAEIQSAQSTSRNIYNVEFQGKKINMSGGGQLATKKGDVMRKNMTKVFDEIISGSDSVKNTEGSPSSSSSKPSSDVVYFGEDVEHGGYYLVTDGLVAKHGERVRDFPPDETSLIGAGIGYAQAGFTPIVEIPYSKYLDCAADMFNEVSILGAFYARG